MGYARVLRSACPLSESSGSGLWILGLEGV